MAVLKFRVPISRSRDLGSLKLACMMLLIIGGQVNAKR